MKKKTAPLHTTFGIRVWQLQVNITPYFIDTAKNTFNDGLNVVVMINEFGLLGILWCGLYIPVVVGREFLPLARC